MPQSINNDRDLKTALKAATTPKDHALIAAYCQAKAKLLNEEAAGYEQAAKTYRNGPVVKNLTAPNTAARYETIANQLYQQARSSREIADAQQHLANEAPYAAK